MSAADVMDLDTILEEPSPTERQIELLLRWGFEIPETKGEATRIISDELGYKRNRGWKEDDYDED